LHPAILLGFAALCAPAENALRHSSQRHARSPVALRHWAEGSALRSMRRSRVQPLAAVSCRAIVFWTIRTFHTRERSGGQRGVPRVDAAAVVKEGLQGAARGGGQRGAPRRRGGGQKGAPRRRGPAAGKVEGLQDLAVHGFAVARPRGRAVYEWLVRYVQCGKQPPLGRYHQADLCRISPTCAPGGCGRGGWGDYGVMVASPAMMLFWVWQKAMVLLRRREFV
jgi:hypothetical protein